jgi:hypothetical protein
VQSRSGVPLHLVPNCGSEGAPADDQPGPRSFRRYPLWRVLSLNGLTVVHYAAGCAAVLVAYRSHPLIAWPIAIAYLVFAMVQFYVLMPLVVCPGCVYRTIQGGRCASGLNLISARFCPPSAGATEFRERTHGPTCQSSLNLLSWVLPIPLALPGLAVSWSATAAVLTAAVVALAAARLAVVTRHALCSHCLAQRWCPVVRLRRAA